MKTQNNDNQVIQFLCQPEGGRSYLLNALNSQSEQVFLAALHEIIDAITQELAAKSV